jgi:hypothetical protein
VKKKARRWIGYVTCIGEIANAFIILDRKPKRKIALAQGC